MVSSPRRSISLLNYDISIDDFTAIAKTFAFLRRIRATFERNVYVSSRRNFSPRLRLEWIKEFWMFLALIGVRQGSSFSLMHFQASPLISWLIFCFQLNWISRWSPFDPKPSQLKRQRWPCEALTSEHKSLCRFAFNMTCPSSGSRRCARN